MLHKLNTFIRIVIVVFLIVPTSAVADHVPTQTPYDISIACNTSNGDITVTWQESDGFEDSPPERYAIGFDVNENGTANAYAVASTPGWQTALSYKTYTFTASYRETIFGSTQGTFNAKVRADNDTDASYSEWTSTVSVACDYGGTTTTSSTTTSSTTTTTTTVPPTTTTSTTTTTTTTTTTLDPLTVQRNNNQAETGIYETDQERKDREDKEYQEWLAREEAKRQAEYEAEQERIRQEEEAERQRKEEERIAAELEAQRLYEEEQERLRLEEEARIQAELEAEQARIKAEQEELARLEAEAEAEIQKELEQSILKDVDVEELSEDELVEVKELIDTIQLIEQTIDFEDYKIEEEVIEIDIVIEDIVVPTTTTTTTLAPIKEDFADEENDLPEDDLDTLPSEEREQEILPELTEEEVIEQVEVAQEVIEEVVNVEEIVEIKTDDELETLTDQEKEVYEEEVKAAIVEAVQELETDELVDVVEQVAQVSVQNLAVADEQTKQVVQAVVNEVTNVETVAELNEEEKQVVAEVLGVTETNDVQIIAEQSAKDENINIAVQEYVDRATENADVEDYSISNVIVEVQVEQFFADPIGQFTDIDLSDIVLSDIGSDMTQSSKDNAKKTVVPVIIVGQIIATPIRRRF